MEKSTQEVFQILEWEVIYQREHWATPDSPKLSLADWHLRIEKHMELAKAALVQGDTETYLFEIMVMSGVAVGCLDSNPPPLRPEY